MGARIKLTVTHDVYDVAGDLQSKGITSQNGGIQHASWLQNHLNSIKSGQKNAQILTTIDDGNPIAATGTITFSGVSTANDTIVVNGVTLTAVASGATNNQWNVGSSASDQASKVAAAINASTTLAGYVTAAAVGAVVTVSAVAEGILGNSVTLAKGTDAGSVMTVGGLSNGRLSGGTNATNSASTPTYGFGL